MSKLEKIKEIILIILTFALSGYLMYSGIKILNQEDDVAQKQSKVKVEDNATK
jgi:cell division protein FtsL